MAITKIQSGALPADVITTAAIDDASVTHAKLHTDMDLSSKTVTLPSAITNTITNKLPLAGGSMTGELIIADTGTLDIRMGTDKRVTWSGALGEIGSVAGFQATNTAGSALSSFGMRGTDLRFATGSEERMRIKDTGVGIGNIAPTSALTIGKGVNTYEDVIAITNFNNDVDVMAAIGFDQSNDTLTIRNDQVFANGGIGFRAGGTTDHLFIRTGGNVGIGTASPTEKLSTLGNVNIGNNDSSNPLSYLRFGATQYGAADIRPSDEGAHKVGLDFYTDGTGDVTINPTFAMRINSSGRVAIGGTTVTDVNMLNIQGSGATSNIGVVLNDTNTSKIYGIQNGGSSLKFFDYSASAERMVIDSSGRVTTPNQPSFSASPSADISMTSNGTAEKLRCNTTAHNIGGHYSTSTFLFTAPVTGSYQFNALLRFNNVGSGYHLGRFYVNGGSHYGGYTISQDTGSYNTVVLSMTILLQANDTISPRMMTSGDTSWIMDNNSSFSGHLIG